MRFLGAKYAENAFAARALIRTPLGELTALSRPLAGFKGPNSKGRSKKGRRGEGKGKEKGRVRGKGHTGTSSPHFEPWTTNIITLQHHNRYPFPLETMNKSTSSFLASRPNARTL